MAIAGRSYANVPVIVRSTLADPPVLTTAPPVVAAAQPDRRWFAPGVAIVTAAPYAPPVIPVATPGPVIVTSQPPVLPAVPPVITRSTLADPPVLTTASPVVIAAAPDRRWLSGNLGVVTILRNTLQDPPVLTTPGPWVTAAPASQRWFAGTPARVISNPPVPPAGPAVTGTWAGAYAVASGFFFPYPAARPVQVSVANTAGDWLFCLIAWRPSAAGSGVSVVVADDAHNWWEPLGPPGTDSPAAGAVRTAVWAAPAARVANTVSGQTIVQVAATGPVLSLACTVIDMSGILPWYAVVPVTGNYANTATSLALSAPAPSAQAVLLAAFASDNNSDTITGPSGWTALTGASASNGVDHTADIKLTPAWQVTTGSSSASVSSGGSLDLAGVIAGVLVSAPQPAQPNPSWPVMVTEAAIGAGVRTPPSELTWTDISTRTLALSMRQGKQYSQGTLSAGQGTITLDNPDGALIPPGTGSFAGIDSGTPLRRRIIWPASATPHYVPFSGYFRRWPWQLDAGLLRGKTQAEITDAWGYAAGPLNSMAIEECLIDSPYALWPATDPAGSAAASDVAPGNSLPLTQVTSKYGAGGAAAVFGASSGQLAGASSAQVTTSGTGGGGTGMWSQSLASSALAYNGFGYALECADPGYPPISGGVTVETWASCTLTADLTAISGNGECLVSTAGAVFNTASSKFPNGMPITLGVLGSSALPGGFSAGTYYVTGSDGQGNYNLSATQGGTAISPSSGGVGTVAPFILWDPVIMSLRDGSGTVAGLSIRETDGALLILQRNGTSVTATVADSGHDYRAGIAHYSLAVTQTAWQLFVNAGEQLAASGTFSPALPASFRSASFAGVQDATSQGYALPGTIGFPLVIPGLSPQVRVVNRYFAAGAAMAGEAACDRIERVLEYAGLAGRRWLGQQPATYEGDLCAPGKDIGGQPAASSAGNIAASTLPAQQYVAPTGDITYLAKLYTWNQPVRWTLGDDTAGGEIPFLPGAIATDYDPARVSSPVQVTSLGSQAVTVPSGATASTTMAAVTAAAGKQYGGQPYQSTCYLDLDFSSQYTAGGSSMDLANWVANIYRKPANRVQAVTVDAARHPAAWPFWGGASGGDMVQVNVRLPTAATSPLISLTARITQTDRASQFSQGGTSGTITCTLDFAPESNCLTCDDPVRGLLNSQNVLGWLGRDDLADHAPRPAHLVPG